MKWIQLIALSFVFILFGCNKPLDGYSKNDLTIGIDPPIEDIIVNKEYDEAGNVIKYDSTYRSFYSNIQNNKMIEDSILNNFKSMFEKKYPFSYNPSFNDFFYRDSLMQYDFYKKDFFKDRFNQNKQWTEKLFQEMDSVKNKFFEEQFPDYER